MSTQNNNGEWKFKMTEWRGYVIRSLEEHDKKLARAIAEISELRDHVNHRMSMFEKELNTVKTKQATSSTEWGIWKGVLIFLGGTVVSIILHFALGL